MSHISDDETVVLTRHRDGSVEVTRAPEVTTISRSLADNPDILGDPPIGLVRVGDRIIIGDQRYGRVVYRISPVEGEDRWYRAEREA